MRLVLGTWNRDTDRGDITDLRAARQQEMVQETSYDRALGRRSTQHPRNGLRSYCEATVSFLVLSIEHL